MFYDIFTNTCKEMGYSPTSVLQQLNISTSKLTAWKKGSTPNSNFVVLISEFLGVTTDYLLKGNLSSSNLTEEESDMISDFRKLDEKHKGVIIGEIKAFLNVQTGIRVDTGF